MRIQNILNKKFFSEQIRRKTALYSYHKDVLKAKMVEFAGYDMPVQYFGILEEHYHCRESASLFDVSHMGQIRIHGKDRVEFIESVCVSDVKELKSGTATLSLFTNEKGGINDDTIITNMDSFLNVVVNAGCKYNDLNNLRKAKEENFKGKDVTIEYIEDRSLIALQGPKAASILQNFVAGNLSNLSFMEASFMSVPNIDENVLVSRCGYTGEDGFEISVSDKNIEKFVDLLLKNQELRPCGLGARDTLRLEAGLCLYGHDINDSTTPIEAALKWVIGKRRKDQGGFPGYDVIKKQMDGTTSTKRVGFIMENGPPAREDSKLLSDDRQTILGKVTSGTFSPTLKKPIGMAYVNSKVKLNSTLKVTIRNREYDVKIAKMPFVPHKYFKKNTSS